MMNRCRPEKKDTKKHEIMLKRVLKFEQGEVLDRNGKGWIAEGKVERTI